MQFSTIATLLFAGVVSAQIGGICFDAGDCLIQGLGTECTRTGISITGTCGASSGSGTTGGGLALPSGLSLPGLKEREAEAEAQE